MKSSDSKCYCESAVHFEGAEERIRNFMALRT